MVIAGVRRGKRRRAVALLLSGAVLATRAPAALAADVQGTLKIPGQVRPSYQTGDTEAPFYLYGDLGVNRLRHGVNGELYFDLYETFGPNDGGGDFYAGMIDTAGAVPMVEMSLGRQFLGEGPRGSNLADSGRVTFDGSQAGVPVAVSVFGGAPRYFEPTVSSPSISQDEQMFGARVIAKQLVDAYANVGFLQTIRDGETLSQLVQVNAGKTFREAPGMPSLYGYFAYDADHSNVDHVVAGVQTVPLPPRLLYNIEATYYDPSDTGTRVTVDPELREDPLFDVFSVSDQLQFKNSLRYIFSPSVSTFANFGYQRYQNSEGSRDVFTDGYLGGAGVHWLPGGDGLESVRLEYYVANSQGGSLNGGRFYYDNWVYDRIHFRTKVDIAYYEKITNQKGTAVATLVGLGYDVLPGLYCETYMEANHNERFDADIRFGLYIVYNWTHRFGQQSSPPPAHGPESAVAPGKEGA